MRPAAAAVRRLERRPSVWCRELPRPAGVAARRVSRAPHDLMAARGCVQAVMASYEEEMKSPIRNLMYGELARTLLIQVRPAGRPAGRMTGRRGREGGAGGGRAEP